MVAFDEQRLGAGDAGESLRSPSNIFSLSSIAMTLPASGRVS